VEFSLSDPNEIRAFQSLKIILEFMRHFTIAEANSPSIAQPDSGILIDKQTSNLQRLPPNIEV
jgi:hypothetical protein